MGPHAAMIWSTAFCQTMIKLLEAKPGDSNPTLTDVEKRKEAWRVADQVMQQFLIASDDR